MIAVVLSLLPALAADALRDTQTLYCGMGYVTGKSVSGTDLLTEWSIAGESNGSCNEFRLSGYWECGDGYNGTMPETWHTYGFSHVHLCDWHDVRISVHYHEGCSYSEGCSGLFSTIVEEW